MPILEKNTTSILFSEDDLPFEEELLRNPFSVKCWLRYIDHKKGDEKSALNVIYERSLKELPGSYKIWYKYVQARKRQCKGLCISEPCYEEANNAFERCLVFMHKMPRIWMIYCQFLVDQGLITRCRRTFDRALRALPITQPNVSLLYPILTEQHRRIWPLYIKFVKLHNCPETSVRVYRRYMKICPEKREDYIEYLIGIDRLDSAALNLAKIINDETFSSSNGKSKHQLWNELCDLCAKNPTKVVSLKVHAIIMQGIRRYSDQVGILWNSLADYYIRNSLFEKARDVFEEAITTVTTVRDFTQVFDAYAECEEGIISAKMEDTAFRKPNPEEDLEMDLRLARLEDLMDRRPLLLNSVLLRQNPHNVHEWHKRVALFEGKPHEIINTYTEAVQTMEPLQATGKFHTIWVSFAKFYEQADQIEDTRIIFEKAVKIEYKNVDELASVWCEWAEMEIRNENYKEVLVIMQRAVSPPAGKVDYHDKRESVQNRVHKSLKVWSMYADMEESFGTYKSCKAVYDRIIDLRIATPQIIINYGMFLEEHSYFEEAFKAYEKGVSLFRWPNVYDIWNRYLTKFIERYSGSKMERTRDLFEQCLEGCPPKFAKVLYLLYAKLEEDYGLARHALTIYDRSASAVLPNEQNEMFNIYIRRAAELYGVTHTRPIYEKAIEILHGEECKDMCIRFADLEKKLGEIDRSRAIYAHCSQICDPRSAGGFWQVWKDFEIKHGNEDTVREMLRIKRSVQATFNTQVNFLSAQMLAAQSIEANADGDTEKNDMQLLEERARQLAAESMKDTESRNIKFVRGNKENANLEDLVKTNNPEEIDIDDEEDAEDDSEQITEIPIKTQIIPSEIYGNLATKLEDEEDDENNE